MLFSPLNARRHELLREAFLEHVDGILDDGEVNIGCLEDVVGKVTLEDALTRVVLIKESGEIGTRERTGCGSLQVYRGPLGTLLVLCLRTPIAQPSLCAA
jgi:hypothetical protein